MMRTLLAALALLCGSAFAQFPMGGITAGGASLPSGFVFSSAQSWQKNTCAACNPNVTPRTLAFASTPSTGTLIVVGCAVAITGNTSCTVTDDFLLSGTFVSTGWVQDIASYGPYATQYFNFFHKVLTLGGTGKTVKVAQSVSASGSQEYFIGNYSVSGGTIAVDGTCGNTNGTGTTLTGPTITTTTTNSIVAAFGMHSGSVAVTQGTGFVIPTNGSSSNTNPEAMEDNVAAPAGGSVTPGFTGTGSHVWAVVACGFKAT